MRNPHPHATLAPQAPRFSEMPTLYQRAALVLLQAKQDDAAAQRPPDAPRQHFKPPTEADCTAMDAYFGPGKEARQDADRQRAGHTAQINDKTGAYQ